MKQQHHVIYVPGIADNVHHVQSLAVKFWRLYGVKGHCHVMPWIGQEPYQPKFERLVAEVDVLFNAGHRVSLVGASAGASVVLNVFADRPDKIHAVVLICPKINHPETVGQATYDKNPAFQTSLAQLQLNLQKLSNPSKARIVTFYSPKDGVIPYEDTLIPGVDQLTLPGLRHGYAIMHGITLGARRLLGQLKRQAL